MSVSTVGEREAGVRVGAQLLEAVNLERRIRSIPFSIVADENDMFDRRVLRQFRLEEFEPVQRRNQYAHCAIGKDVADLTGLE